MIVCWKVDVYVCDYVCACVCARACAGVCVCLFACVWYLCACSYCSVLVSWRVCGCVTVWVLKLAVLLKYQRVLTALPVFPAIWRQFLLETEAWYLGLQEGPTKILAGESVSEYLGFVIDVIASDGAFAQDLWEQTWQITNRFCPNLLQGRNGEGAVLVEVQNAAL